MAYTGIEPMTLELAASCSKRFLRTIQQFSVSWAWKPLPFKNIYFHFLPDSFEKQHNTQSFLVIFFPLYLRLKIFIRRWTNIYTYTHTHTYICLYHLWLNSSNGLLWDNPHGSTYAFWPPFFLTTILYYLLMIPAQ